MTDGVQQNLRAKIKPEDKIQIFKINIVQNK